MANQTIKTKKWLIAERTQSDLVDQLLANRNIPTNQWSTFLNPDYVRDSHDPFLLPDMKSACDRINEAVAKKQKIGIFADYDADGIPGAAILETAFKKIGLQTVVYIPSRKEGYGLNRVGLDYIIAEGVDLVITVDLGIRNSKEAQYLRDKKIDLIITDHHEPDKVLPEALAVINPKRTDSKYPFRQLSGGGVAFKLVQALLKTNESISASDIKWLLDLTAITTICDMVPLIDENRMIAKFGLIVLSKTRRPGLLELYDIVSIDKEKIDTYTVGFQIGPRINAPGRLDHTTQSYELLVSSDPKEARSLAKKLDQINFTRQSKMEEVLADVELKISKKHLLDKKIIILRDPSWPSGINGLIAGKITEKYHRPCIIFEKGEEFSKGSARSIDQFNIVKALEDVSRLLVNFGGHTKAAGMTLLNENFDQFVKEMEVKSEALIGSEDLIPSVFIDAELMIKDLNLKTFREVSCLEPYGLGNPRPVFCLKGIKPQFTKTMGMENKHLKMSLNGLDIVAFGHGYLAEKIKLSKNIDIAFTLDNNIWRGIEKIQLKVVDLIIN